MIDPQQGASYESQLRVARAAEELGFDGFFRTDHYLRMGDVDGLPGPTDSWITLGGLARETTSIRLGTLVSAATFRLPGVLAIQVAQVDAMSSGRVELGLGSGWYEAEHTACGIPFPPARIARLAEQLEIVTGLWQTPIGDTFSFAGRYYTLTDSPALPKPAQPRVPIIVGGAGTKRTPALAARFADEFNTSFATVADSGAQFDRVRAAMLERDRDVDSIVFSVGQLACVGKNDADLAARAVVTGMPVDQLRPNALVGTPGEVVDKLGQFAEHGVTRVYLQLLDLTDLDQLELVSSAVLPQLG